VKVSTFCVVYVGGVLSVNVYVNELIESLEASGYGCHVGKEFYSCFMSA